MFGVALIVAALGAYLNCTDLTLPEYESTGRYLVLSVRGPTDVVLTSDNSTIDTNPFSVFTPDDDFTLEGHNRTDWRVIVYEFTIDGYDESALLTQHMYVFIDVEIDSIHHRTYHYVGDASTDLCSTVFGKSMSANAPIVGIEQTHPVDVLIQAPPIYVMLENDDTIINYYTIESVDPPRGTVLYTNNLTTQTQTRHGYPIAALASIDYDGGLEDHTNLDYAPLISGMFPNGGMVSIHDTTHIPFIFDNNITIAPNLDSTDPILQYAKKHLNLQPSAVRVAMSIEIGHSLRLIPIFAGMSPNGNLNYTLASTVVSYTGEPPSVDIGSFDCKDLVTVIGASELVWLCYSQQHNNIVAIKPIESTTITVVSSVSTIGGSACDGQDVMLVRSGECAAVLVCGTGNQQVGTYTYYWAEVTETTIEPFVSTTINNILYQPTFIGASPLEVGWCGLPSLTNVLYAIFSTASGKTIFMFDGTATATPWEVYDDPDNTLMLARLSTNGYHGLGFDTDTEDFYSDIWTTELGDNRLPGTTLFLTTIVCTTSTHECYLTMVSADGTAPDSFGACTIDINNIYVGSSYNMVNNIARNVIPFSHTRVNTSNPMLPSFPIIDVDQELFDVYVFYLTTNIRRCIYYDTQLLCIEDFPITSDDAISNPPYSHQRNVFSAGPMVAFTTGYIPLSYQTESLILTNTSGPSEYCHNTTSNPPDDATVQLMAIGASSLYTAAATGAIDLVTSDIKTSYFNPFTGSFGFLFLGGNTVYQLEYQATCNHSNNLAPTHASFFQLYPGHVSWCNALTNNITGDSVSPYLPDGETAPYKANQDADGNTISIPHLTSDDYFSHTTNTFCDGSNPPTHHGIGTALELYQSDQSHSRLRVASFICTSVHSDYPIATPVAMLLQQTMSHVYWYDYPMCYPADPTANISSLPYIEMLIPATQQSHVGHGHYDTTAAPTPQRCDPSTEYLDPDTLTCIAITSCSGGEFELRHPLYSLDRQCQTLMPCIPGIDYESVPPTETSDRECVPISSCSIGEYISHGATVTSDVVCRGIISTCVSGQYINTSAQVDAAPGEVNLGEQCPACENGTTYNPSCENGVAHCNPHHTETECVEANVSWTCPDEHYLSVPVEEVVGHPILYCKPCGSCILESASCTPTSNVVCVPQLGADPPDVPLKCPKGQWANPHTPLRLRTCEPWQICAYIKIEGTSSTERICAKTGSEKYVYEAVYIAYVPLFFIVVSRIYIYAQPWTETKKKLASHQ
jgi:hypothetical protein